MSRNLIAGSVAGVALSVVTLASVSLMLPPVGAGAPGEPAENMAETMAPEAVAPAPETAEATAPEAVPDAPATTETQAAAAPETEMMEVPEGSEFAKPKSEGEAELPGTEQAPASEAAPAAIAPAAEPAPELAGKAPAAVPESPTEAPGLTAPEEPAESAPVAAAPAADAAPAVAEPAPALAGGGEATEPAPAPAAEPVAVAEPPESAPVAPAEPEAQPLAEAPTAAPAAEAPASEGTEIALAEDPLTQPAPPEAAPEPPPVAEPAAAAEPEPEAAAVPEAAPAPEVTTAPEAAPVPEAAPAPEPAPEPAPAEAAAEPAGTEPLPEPEDATEPETTEAAPAADEPETNTLPQIVPEPEVAEESLPAPDEGTDEPRIIALDEPEPAAEDAPQIGLGREVAGVKVNRLPTIGGDAGASDPAVSEAPPVPEAVSGPLAENAAVFANPEGKPLLAVVLIDRGVAGGGLDPSALASLPFPATIALDPMREDAAVAAESYRSAGSEVAILAGDLPEGATPADFEVTYQSYVTALPQAVALIGEPDAAFQRSSLSAQHVAALLAADGRGFITYEQGLNAGRRAAEREGVPHASVGRLFGAGEDNAGTLGRELDRAAFAAGQNGQMVIALPSTPEAVTALLAWAAGPSAGGVAIGPVSAIMLAPEPVPVAEPVPEPPPEEPAAEAPQPEGSGGSGESSDGY